MPARRMARGAVCVLAAVLLLAGCTSAPQPAPTATDGEPAPSAPATTAPEVNAHLEQFADAQGFPFFDPWKNLTNKDGKWRTEFFRDGIHTNMTGYKLMGAEVRTYIRPEVLDDGAQK